MTEPAESTAKLPEQLASFVNLTVHPVAAVAAVSALGLGLASQSLGLWFGTMSAAAEAMGRLSADAASEAKSSAAQRAEATARTLIAKAKRVAREVADASAEVAQPKAVAPGATVELMSVPKPAAPTGAPAAIAKPKKPDDLKKIAGVGPKLESVLNGLGIWTFAQVAAWSPVEIAWLDNHLGFSGRIERDRWVEQATALSRGKGRS
jgi:NADH-quinone oxidoreductase subunit E